MKEKYGFVYLWFDRKHKRYYVGSHWGTEDDGYICSSSWMKRAYLRRSSDFKRRILTKNIPREILRNVEKYWLNMIKRHELRFRYYNLITNAEYLWHDDSKRSLSIKEKIRRSSLNRLKDDPNWSNRHSTKMKELNRCNPELRVQNSIRKKQQWQQGIYKNRNSINQRKAASRAKQKTYLVQFPDGHSEQITNLTSLCEYHKLARCHLHHTLLKGNKHKGFKLLERLESNNDHRDLPPTSQYR